MDPTLVFEKSFTPSRKPASQTSAHAAYRAARTGQRGPGEGQRAELIWHRPNAPPGPAVVLPLKSALLRGRQAAIGVAFGVLVADLVWAMATAAGLTALLVSSQIAIDIVRVVGALYLLYLGVRLALSRNLAVLGSATQASTETDRRGGLLRSFARKVASPKNRGRRLAYSAELVECEDRPTEHLAMSRGPKGGRALFHRLPPLQANANGSLMPGR
ncbi:LysE family translocator [Nocardia sp. CC227C]|uniref:LysE family translocator n=1 Tax=Nocardia sp. CC227C TaxID=3044562 RepID=UPI0035565872